MNAFIDPRGPLNLLADRPVARLTEEPDDLSVLCQLSVEGRLYEVERWIQTGHPLQLAVDQSPGRSRWRSPLRIALEARNHALVLLLLSNGYDPNREYESPLNVALEARRWDLLDLLLEWGANPLQVDLEDLFGTYRSELFERFRSLGVDLTAGHALAYTLTEHTSNKPLFGFAKRHRAEDTKIQTELNIALLYHAEKGHEKGVQLCLWAGAEPHAPAPSLRWGFLEEEEDGEDGEEGLEGSSAVEAACRYGNAQIVERLGPDPSLDDFDKLYRAASTTSVLDLLAHQARPRDGGAVLRHHLWWASFDLGFGLGTGRSLSTVQHLFELGVRWGPSTKEEIAEVRGWLLKASKYRFVDAMKLLSTGDYCSPEILQELARTPAMRRRMKEVGFIRQDDNEGSRFRREPARPTGSHRVLKKFGVAPPKQRPKPKRSVPQVIHLGRRRAGSQEIRMSRAEFFKRVWSTPASQLAEIWGVSDTAIRKACRRVGVPTPGRGFWQKIHAGRRVPKPRLPKPRRGQAETIVVWIGD